MKDVTNVVMEACKEKLSVTGKEESKIVRCVQWL